MEAQIIEIKNFVFTPFCQQCVSVGMGIMSFGTHRLWRAGEAELVSNLALLHLECAPPDEVGDGASGAAAVDGLLGGVVRVLHAGEGHVAEEAAAAGEATGGLAGLKGGETLELLTKEHSL